jgi:hypothetical protein
MPSVSRHLSQAVLVLTLASASIFAGRASAEDAVLIASTVPGYVPGMVVSSNDQLRVPDGASATLLFQSGEMLRLRGPFDGTLGQPQPVVANGSAATFADMFHMRGVDATVIGGTRSTGSPRSRLALDDVQVDADRSGTYCIEPSTTVWITRPGDEQGHYALRRKGSSRMLEWPQGADRIEWPADVPIDDGSQFEIVTTAAARATVTFRALPTTVGSALAQVASGLVRGCHEQFDRELKRLSRTIAGPEVWITTDRGRRPAFHAGEPIMLTITADMDGYLYCVAIADDGSAKPIFPAGAVEGSKLRGSVPLSIPGPRQPAGIIASSGLARVRCWLADRDITPELPHALLNATSVRLPDQLAGDLNSLFAHINGTRIEEDAVTIRTE